MGKWPLPRFQKKNPKDECLTPLSCQLIAQKILYQQRPAEIIAFLGRHVPSSMAGPLFYLLYDMAPCRTPRASVAGDKVKLLKGWRVNASSLQVLGPARSFPKTEARYSYRDRMDDIVFGLRQDECPGDCPQAI